MKITRIETFRLRIALVPERRMVSALGHHDVSHYCLVRVQTNGAMEGVGEATVTPRWSGETAWSAQAAIEQLFAPRLLGVDVRDIDQIERCLDAAAVGNPFAKAAVEMACWDICGKAAGRPVYELLGGPCRGQRVACRFSLGAYRPDRAARIAADRVAAGFSTIKIKVGGQPDEDVARVRAVRQAVGPNVELLVDANGGWDAATAIQTLHALDDCRLGLVEQPVPRGDIGGMAQVRRAIDLPVMADESCFEPFDLIELIRNEACDVVSLYPGKQGGLRRAYEMAQLAEQHGVACSIGSNLEWDIATAAMGHLVLAHRNMQVERYPGDMLGPVYHDQRVVRQPIAIEGPLVTVPDGAGLGIDADWPTIARLASNRQ